MIGRKLVLLNNMEGHNTHNVTETFLSEILDFDKIKNTTIKNLRRVEHVLIWIILRTYLVSKNFVNKKSKEIVEKIKTRLNRNRQNHILEEKKEVSKYIKVISDYRQKIRHIKHKIKEEEGIE